MATGRSTSATTAACRAIQGQGPLSISNTEAPWAINIDDSADFTPRTATVNDTSVNGLAPAAINYEQVNGTSPVTIDGGSGGNSFTAYGSPTHTIAVNSGSGDDTVNMQASGGNLTVNGQGGTNTLVGANANSTWTITGTNSGMYGSAAFSSFQNLTGGTGLDVFQFAPGGAVTGPINGGGGGDWLDYSRYTAAVAVDLENGTATGVGGTVQNIQDVRGDDAGDTLTGDTQGDILIGGAGVDSIAGGTGGSILIGGTGADSVTGNTSDDIVIGGTTTYDGSSIANDMALESILAEWQSADSFSQRVMDIKDGNGVGLNGSNTLVLGSTVHDDGAANTLTGGGGLDWFFKGGKDTITDLKPGDQVN